MYLFSCKKLIGDIFWQIWLLKNREFLLNSSYDHENVAIKFINDEKNEYSIYLKDSLQPDHQ